MSCGAALLLLRRHAIRATSRVGPAGTGPNLRICREKSQIRRPSGLPSRARPPAQIGLRSDLEVARGEVATKSFRRNVSALRNKISHQVDADGEHHGSGWKVDGGQLFPGRNDGAALACARTTPLRCAHQLIRATVLPSLTHHHYVRTPRCLQLLLISLVRRACAAGLLLRLPASQPEQATAGSAAVGHAGGQEATCRGRS